MPLTRGKCTTTTDESQSQSQSYPSTTRTIKKIKLTHPLTRPAKTTRPGVRSVAPKKAGLIKQKKLTKVRTDMLRSLRLLDLDRILCP